MQIQLRLPKKAIRTVDAMAGFTLIEILIILAIISILAATAIPQFMQYRVKAYNSASDRRYVQYSSLLSDIDEARTKVELSLNDIDRVKAALSNVKSITRNKKEKLEFVKYMSRLDEINTRLTKLETIIVPDPSKALTLELLRKDIEHIRDSIKNDLASLKERTDYNLSMNKWFITFMVMNYFAVAGILIALVVQIRKANKIQTGQK